MNASVRTRDWGADLHTRVNSRGCVHGAGLHTRLHVAGRRDRGCTRVCARGGVTGVGCEHECACTCAGTGFAHVCVCACVFRDRVCTRLHVQRRGLHKCECTWLCAETGFASACTHGCVQGQGLHTCVRSCTLVCVDVCVDRLVQACTCRTGCASTWL